jgi:hypothetical protein
MLRSARVLLAAALFCLLPIVATQVSAQTHAPAPRVDVLNTRLELSGRFWAKGSYIAFCVDEETVDFNGDKDTDDTIVFVLDTRTMQTVPTGLAVDFPLTDNDEDWPVAIGTSQVVVRALEKDTGKDLNGDGKLEGDVLCSFNPATRKYDSLRISGKQPQFSGDRLYYLAQEGFEKKDLNGDGDGGDWVICTYDTASKQVQSLGMEAAAGFNISGDWISALTNEGAQGAKDLDGDKDVADVVVQLHQISVRRWTNTGLEGSYMAVLTPKLLAVAVDEKKQGNQDLDGDGDTDDVVCFVRDHASGTVVNLKLDCSSGLSASDDLVGFVVQEYHQGKQDLNGDRDATDDVAQVYRLGMQRPINLARDASGGLVVDGGKVVFGMAEEAQAKRDLNRDMDVLDTVLQVYDPVKNSVSNSGLAIDSDLTSGEGIVVFRVSETDQFNRDINRDGDADDSIVHVLYGATGGIASTNGSGTDFLSATARAVTFAMPEADQGNRDLNGDGDTEDTIVQVARLTLPRAVQ